MKQLVLPFEDTIDTATAARIARVSQETVRRWCDEGIIKATKLVGPWKIDRHEFIVWIDSKRTQSTNSGQ